MWYWVRSGDIIIKSFPKWESFTAKPTWNRGYYMPARGVDFIFKCSTRYRTAERGERLGWKVQHGKMKFVYTSQHVMFSLLYKHTYEQVFDDIPEIFDTFILPKIFQNRSEGQTSASERFPSFSKSYGRLSKTTEKDLKMFRPCIHQKKTSVV